MKKIFFILSLISFTFLTACGSTQDIESESPDQSHLNSNSQAIENEDIQELTEEEINALFQDMMQQIENELTQIEEENSMDTELQEAFNNLVVDENGELNPWLSEMQ